MLAEWWYNRLDDIYISIVCVAFIVYGIVAYIVYKLGSIVQTIRFKHNEGKYRHEK